MAFGPIGQDPLPFQDAPPQVVIPGAGLAPADDGAGEVEFDTALEREIEGTTELQLRTWIDLYGPEGISSTIRNQFVDRWLLREPGAGVEALTRDDRFLTGLNHLPFFDVLPPPAFVTPEGQGFTWDISSGFRPLSTEEFQLVAGTSGLPTFDLFSAAQQVQVRRSGGGGRGGGGRGGGGRAPRVFDTRQLEQAAEALWRRKLLDFDEPAIKNIVKEYVAAANAFWTTQGGSLDFETFVTDKIQATDRYQTLYAKKPAEISDEQFMAQFQQAVSQGGGTALRPTQQLEQLETSLTSGGSPGGQARRIAQTEDVLRAQPANFANQFARQLQSLGRAALR